MACSDRELQFLSDQWEQREKREDRRSALLAMLLFNSGVDEHHRKSIEHFMLHFPDPIKPKQLPKFEDYLKQRKRLASNADRSQK